MSTVVFVHAHPDDEASQSAGSMARAVSEGHRVVLVVATNGDHGDAPDDLAEGETVVQRRRVEAAASNAVIGTHRVEFLGYADSGMTGWVQNDHEESFVRADTEEAAARLAGVLREEEDRKSTRLNSSHVENSYAVFCLKKKKKKTSQISGSRSRSAMHSDTRRRQSQWPSSCPRNRSTRRS